ncbi:hypothetical protein HZS_5922 [Henneguya salminicola]|nr:hypothetical protein HZS_5922 [Henneguya salminicola]
MINIIKILFWVFNAKSEIIFDKNAKEINQIIIYKFHGYRSFANEGPLLGCCGNQLAGICQPCQYTIIITKL